MQIKQLHGLVWLYWVKVALLPPSAAATFTLENCTQPSFGKSYLATNKCQLVSFLGKFTLCYYRILSFLLMYLVQFILFIEEIQSLFMNEPDVSLLD